MTVKLTAEQHEAICREDGKLVRAIDEAANTTYVLVPEDVFERVRTLLGEPTRTAAEQRFHLREMGRRAGWDDPEMDVYNDLDPRKS